MLIQNSVSKGLVGLTNGIHLEEDDKILACFLSNLIEEGH